MEEQIREAVELAHKVPGHFREQLDRMNEFREKMQISGGFTRTEQFAVRKVSPIEPRRSIAIHK